MGKDIGVQIEKYVCRQAGNSTGILSFRYSSNHVFKCACKHVRRLAFLPARLHAVPYSSNQACKYIQRSAGTQAFKQFQQKEIFSQKKQKNGKKKKKAILQDGMQADKKETE
ncbi:hypothetical protein [Flavobacterium notoginsengisoli]|uniref:hypothetical protein n=1 Tax=Flavobacterium notoginsengisoli TaxID=1478199 RepID=UPI00363043F0